MTRPVANPMPREMRGRLGGLANSVESQRAKGIKGQAVTRERYGDDQLVRARLRRTHPNIATIAPSKMKTPRGNEGPSTGVKGND
mgnify:CR=1 FL=1